MFKICTNYEFRQSTTFKSLRNIILISGEADVLFMPLKRSGGLAPPLVKRDRMEWSGFD
jgi:hypothetical protein